ncbi:MAG: hypothetical protein LM582_04475 [Desulfurococcaceae archaeon]|nr:hypothetical protein [Desulfurococcaceae archaeon]
MSRRLLIFIAILVVIVCVAIPIAFYLTYPVEEEVVEQIVEDVYIKPPYPIPRFVPGVIGYASSIGRDFRYRGVFHVYGGDLNIITTSEGHRIHVVFLPWYRCTNNKSFILFREALAKFMDGREVVVMGLTFRTPKGLIFVPLDIKLGNTSCIYLRKR